MEHLGSYPGPFVVSGGLLYFASQEPQGDGAPLFRVEPSKLSRLDRREVFAFGRGGAVGDTLHIAGAYLYWQVKEADSWEVPLGGGPLLATRLIDGHTTTVLRCEDDDGHACPRLLDGSPPLVRHAGKLLRVDAGRVVAAVEDPCPDLMLPVRALGEYVRCVSTVYPTPSTPEPTVVLLAGGEAIDGIGEGARWVGGHLYHRKGAGIMRRSRVDGKDELVVAVGSAASSFVVDDAGLVWIDGVRLTAAPLPR